MFEISNQAIKEFQQIHFRKYGEKLSFEKAKEQALKLLQIFKIIFKPISYEKNQS